MKKVLLAVMILGVLTACKQKDVSISPEDRDSCFADSQTIEAVVDEDTEDEKILGYYAFEFDSTIRDFVYCEYDSVNQVTISYYSEQKNLIQIRCAIDDIIINKGWRYPLDSWHEFEEDLASMLSDSIEFQLSEVEIEVY